MCVQWTACIILVPVYIYNQTIGICRYIMIHYIKTIHVRKTGIAVLEMVEGEGGGGVTLIF